MSNRFSIHGHTFSTDLLQPVAYENRCAERCHGVCCRNGVYVSGAETDAVLARAEAIAPLLHHLTPPEAWFDVVRPLERDLDRPGAPLLLHTQLAPDPFLRNPANLSTAEYEEDNPGGCSCVFLTADRKCALQVWAHTHGQMAWAIKPRYCWLFPLTYDAGCVTLDERAFGHCFAPATTPVPAYTLVAHELQHLLGAAGYADFVAYAHRHTPPTVPSHQE